MIIMAKFTVFIKYFMKKQLPVVEFSSELGGCQPGFMLNLSRRYRKEHICGMML